MRKKEEYKRAVLLRKQGMTYPEIAKELSVAKSTLSLWLRDIPIPKQTRRKMRMRATARRIKSSAGAVSGAFRDKRKRLIEEARKEFDGVHPDYTTAIFVGAALYWAEGAKNRNTLTFCNSDPCMVDFYVKWLVHVLGVPTEALRCSIQAHLDKGLSYEQVEKWWSRRLKIPQSQFTSPYIRDWGYKRNKRSLTYGILTIRVKKPQQYRSKYLVLVEKLGAELISDFIE